MTNIVYVAFVFALLAVPLKLFSYGVIQDDELFNFRSINEQVEDEAEKVTKSQVMEMLLGTEENANPFLQECIVTLRNYAILLNFKEHLRPLLDEEASVEKSKSDYIVRGGLVSIRVHEHGFKKFMKTIDSVDSIGKFLSYAQSNMILSLHGTKEMEAIKEARLFSEIEINVSGDVFVKTLEGEFSPNLVSEAIKQISQFLEKYEFVFESHNPFLTQMSDAELEDYKGELDKAVIEFTNFDYIRAMTDFADASSQYGIGIKNYNEKMTMDSGLSQQRIESLSLKMALLESVGWASKVVESSFFGKNMHPDEAKPGALTVLWLVYEMWGKRSIPNHFRCRFERWAEPDRFPAGCYLNGYTPDEKKLIDQGSRRSELCEVNPFPFKMYENGELYMKLTGDAQCNRRSKSSAEVEECNALYESYCESIDPNKAMVRMDAFWKVWGAVVESGQDPWSYWLSEYTK